jgi:opacity protein-like surface antigen
MKNKTTVAVIVFLLALGATVARAQEKVPENSRVSIMALGGYRSSGEFQITSEDVAYSTLRMKGGLAYGLAVGYRLMEVLSVEATWIRSGSSLEGVFPVAEALPNVKLFSLSEDQFHANILLSAGYSIGKVDPYFLLGLGLTSINPSGDVPGASRFSWNLGAGFKAMISKKIGLRGQAELVPTYISNIDTILNEWVGGVQTVSLRNTMVQWQFTVGLFFRL